MRAAKLLFIFVLSLVLQITGIVPCAEFTAKAETSAVSISKSKLTLEIGKSENLTLKGTSRVAVWKTSSKKIATVSRTGKVTAKSIGTAKITATLGKASYSCRVTVKGSIDSYKKGAPFDARKVKIGKISSIIPEDWFFQVIEDSDGDSLTNDYVISIAPTESQSSSITIFMEKTDEKAEDYSILKSDLESSFNADSIQQMMKDAYGNSAKITGFNASDFNTDLGTAYRVEYVLTVNKVSSLHTNYTFHINNYSFDITVNDTQSCNIDEAAQYFLKSIVVN